MIKLLSRRTFNWYSCIKLFSSFQHFFFVCMFTSLNIYSVFHVLLCQVIMSLFYYPTRFLINKIDIDMRIIMYLFSNYGFNILKILLYRPKIQSWEGTVSTKKVSNQEGRQHSRFEEIYFKELDLYDYGGCKSEICRQASRLKILKLELLLQPRGRISSSSREPQLFSSGLTNGRGSRTLSKQYPLLTAK